MSDYAVSFHYMQPMDMYKMEYYVYQLKPYGVEKEQDETVVTREETDLPWTREERMGNHSLLSLHKRQNQLLKDLPWTREERIMK